MATAELKEHPLWVVERSRLYRNFRFGDFLKAIAFVNQVAELAERRGHHPNICVHEWCFVHLELYSHADGGLSRFDFEFALALDEMIASGAGAAS
ncbi:MAG: 4a-hydroxytetrahydrobiopterin dehydratase [Candidatus Dormibacteraeota bacterium]|nr:4a-hydroxytetrahydrobiopterin dehydratase [Candidatus Dormibacteraeota bacterium]